ncbi:hypothetical protein [Candidatus Mycobacterium methanotrophicum]|uniref:Uncharacterized protein n=1 Tax=Candidatus Mycobacterium methanotrophicum TaxID=2943498 RepID=A0ABY4QTW2_9MYCO|nr:hypothetical protein [Candidatus Mycobacterium methanotrophicum]UQX13560.1 hypothetical protein M5I08_25550 [Candidatus Mycobacterium methanotrophicum]
MNVIIDQRTGRQLRRFASYAEAAAYRRDVLRPALDPDQPCPFLIRGVPPA